MLKLKAGRPSKGKAVTLSEISNAGELSGFSINIPRKTHIAFKIKCAQEGVTQKETLTKIIENYING